MHGADASWSNCKCVVADGCATNLACQRMLCDTSFGSTNIGADFTSITCFAHCFNNAGGEIGFNHLTQFMSACRNLFGRSDAAKDICQQECGTAWKGHSETRWWSEHRQLRYLQKHIDKIPVIIARCSQIKVGEKSVAKLLKLLNDKIAWSYVLVELGAAVKFMGPLCDITYKHESDTQECFKIAEAVEDLLNYYPDQTIDLDIDTGDTFAINMHSIIQTALTTTTTSKSIEELAQMRANLAALIERGPVTTATIIETGTDAPVFNFHFV